MQESGGGVGEELMGILWEGLGMKRESSLEGRVQADHYYPYCPQPDLTVGLGSHTDPGVLVQNEVVGKIGLMLSLSLPGALVINIGDIYSSGTLTNLKLDLFFCVLPFLV